jgi:leucyl aminopeptidase
MQVNVTSSLLESIDVPIVVVGFTEEEAKSPKYDVINTLVASIVELGDFIGERGSSGLLYTQDMKSKRVMFVGLGKEAELTIETVRKVVGSISRTIRDHGIKHAGLFLSSFTAGKLEKNLVAEALAQSVIMGSYNEPYYKTKELEKIKQLTEITLFDPEILPGLEEAAYRGKVIGEAVNYCRKLAWGPGNLVTPSMLAAEAERIGDSHNLKVTVFDRETAQEIGLHSFLAVARGTDEPPKFIILEYDRGKKDADTIALVGKGITFDTGGISIKPSDGMPLMKADMTGGAVVLAVMEAIAKLDLNLHVVGLVPATDNMPDGKAYHPGDVVKSYSGQTIEVISTDAEGRMILNDALSYAAKNYKPKAMFDFATLTGAMHVAIGDHAIGFFSNSDWVAEKLELASKASGERVWRMPLWEEYDEQLKSDVADFKHTGGRPAGAITAARFLSKFVMDTPWAHLDIAGHPEQKSDKDYNPKGSKGPAVRLVLEMLRTWN